MVYSLQAKEVITNLGSSDQGLASEEVKSQLEKYCPNELVKEKKASVLKLHVNQFKNALILLLVFAAFLSLFLVEFIDSAAMFFIILMNIILGFIQESKSERAIDDLESMSASTSKVLRISK